MKIMILGADGYLGWPTAVDLAFKKHKLMLVDSYIKRRIMQCKYVKFRLL
jgi:UDP-sulfoquinovose synthase